jgi:ferric-dicitrate binding protein FerR (iron transport regulator)
LEEKNSYSVKELTENPSFSRWINGEAEKEEADFWDQWIEGDERNRKVARRAQQFIRNFHFVESSLPDVDEEWNQVRHKLGSGIESRPQFQFHHYRRFQELKKDTFFTFLKVAAIVLIAFGASWFFMMNSQLLLNGNKQSRIQTITTNYGEKKIIQLSPGSKIILAAGSSLSHPKDWKKEAVKHVKLKGEAYFSMHSNGAKDRPELVVQTDDGTISDWGTQFTVSTYGNGTQVVLKKGKVKLNVVGNAAQKPTTMKPGDLANFKKYNKKVSVKSVNPLVYTSWASNKLVFDHTPLSLLVKRIKHTYGVRVKVKDKNLLSKKLSGSVRFDGLKKLIHAVNQVLSINITLKNNTVYINKTI